MLSGPHQRFAEGIASGLNQTEAYRAAYPKATTATAGANGHELLKNTEITAEIARLREAAKNAADGPVLTLADKLKFLAEVVQTNVGEINEDSRLCQEFTDEVTAMGAKKKYKMPCKLRALELHAKLSGELSDKVQVSADADLLASIATGIQRLRK
jgi:phage terminase small subunit